MHHHSGHQVQLMQVLKVSGRAQDPRKNKMFQALNKKCGDQGSGQKYQSVPHLRQQKSDRQKYDTPASQKCHKPKKPVKKNRMILVDGQMYFGFGKRKQDHAYGEKQKNIKPEHPFVLLKKCFHK
jgi:hypothetical protein